jgi:NAD(P)-dependent dehydrogenase (short-subunit alcohol dehydrogenase family)
MTKFDLRGRTVAITGSTGGLGTGVTKALQARGANLALMDFDLAMVTAQAKALDGESVARGWQVDVRKMDSLQEAMDSAAQHFGRLDVVLANAGVTTVAPMSILEPSAFESVIDINLNGVWRTFKAGLPHVQKQRGYMAATSSMAAFVHSPLQASYAASKAGVWALCDCIRLEVRHLGVGIGSIHPTFFKTPMMDHVTADPAGNKLWNGNSGMWRMIDIELVVRGIVRGIERRSDFVVIPRFAEYIAKRAGLFRKIIECRGFRDKDIQEAIRLSSPTGWSVPNSTGRGASA